MLIGSCSNSAPWKRTGLPSRIREASRLVPPMSMVIRLGSSISSENAAAPMTPPAGPDRIRLTGCSREEAAVIAPPPDRVIRNRPLKPSSASDFSRACR